MSITLIWNYFAVSAHH